MQIVVIELIGDGIENRRIIMLLKIIGRIRV
jgi:hypothetical protein